MKTLCDDCKPKPIMILCAGPAGGKDRLSQNILNLIPSIGYIGCGDTLRRVADSDSPYATQIGELQAKGDKVPCNIVFEIIREKIEGLRGPAILDGFPRTPEQARILASLPNEFFGIRINRDHGFRRVMLQRRIDAAHSRGVAPRKDDNPFIFEKRSKGFEDEELPAFLEFVRMKNVSVFETEHNVPDLDKLVGKIVEFHIKFFSQIRRC